VVSTSHEVALAERGFCDSLLCIAL
jgi:hypothetical protein